MITEYIHNTGLSRAEILLIKDKFNFQGDDLIDVDIIRENTEFSDEHPNIIELLGKIDFLLVKE